MHEVSPLIHDGSRTIEQDGLEAQCRCEASLHLQGLQFSSIARNEPIGPASVEAIPVGAG